MTTDIGISLNVFSHIPQEAAEQVKAFKAQKEAYEAAFNYVALNIPKMSSACVSCIPPLHDSPLASEYGKAIEDLKTIYIQAAHCQRIFNWMLANVPVRNKASDRDDLSSFGRKIEGIQRNISELVARRFSDIWNQFLKNQKKEAEEEAKIFNRNRIDGIPDYVSEQIPYFRERTEAYEASFSCVAANIPEMDLAWASCTDRIRDKGSSKQTKTEAIDDLKYLYNQTMYCKKMCDWMKKNIPAHTAARDKDDIDSFQRGIADLERRINHTGSECGNAWTQFKIRMQKTAP